MPVGQENGFDIGIRNAHVPHTIFFLVAARELMLLDDAVHIVRHIGAKHDTILRLSVHFLSVEVVVLRVVLNEPLFVLELFEILLGTFVYLGIIFVEAVGKLNLGLDDMIERLLIVAGLSLGLVRAEHIIGTRGYLLDKRLGRP